MKRDTLIKQLMEEAKGLGVLLAAIMIVLKIAFYRESAGIIAVKSLSIFWLFVLPGYSILLIWKDRLDFTSRAIMGVPVSAFMIGILGYYISLMGIDARYHPMVLPPLMMAIPVIYLFCKRR